MNGTEELTKNEHIEIDGTLEAVLTDLRRRFDAGELRSLDFEATDCNNNTLSGSTSEMELYLKELNELRVHVNNEGAISKLEQAALEAWDNGNKCLAEYLLSQRD